jgi:hypothetical protein
MLAACGGDPGDADPTVDASPPDAMPREVITATRSLQPLELVEGTMTGGPGDVAVIELSAPTADFGWNIHGHANGGTQVVIGQHDQMMVRYTFAPTSMADWYLLVRNEAEVNLEVQVRVELYGDLAWAWL